MTSAPLPPGCDGSGRVRTPSDDGVRRETFMTRSGPGPSAATAARPGASEVGIQKFRTTPGCPVESGGVRWRPLEITGDRWAGNGVEFRFRCDTRAPRCGSWTAPMDPRKQQQSTTRRRGYTRRDETSLSMARSGLPPASRTAGIRLIVRDDDCVLPGGWYQANCFRASAAI
jgi:hypothetical protein